MPYTLTPRVNHTVELSARLDPEVVERERQAILVKLRRKAQVPGFRRGKAPLGLIGTRFAEEIQEELEDSLAGEVWREALEAESDLRPLTSPSVRTRGLDPDGSFHYTAAFEVRPRYELPPVEGLRLPEVSLEVTTAAVDAELDRIGEEHAAWEPENEQAAVDGTLVEGEVWRQVGDRGEPPGNGENLRLVLGDPDLPVEIGTALKGVRPGEERVAERVFPEDYDNPDLAGKLVRYRIVVKSLKRKVLPAVDDDLARTVGLESLEALRLRVEEALAVQRKGERYRTWQRAMLDQLEEQLDSADLPPSLVAEALREDMGRFAYTMAMQGMDPKSDQVDWQQVQARLEPAVRRRVLDDLVLEQLADGWAMSVPEETVEAVIRQQAARLAVPPAEHRANLAKENRLDELRHAARMSATVDELIRRAGGEIER